VRTNPELERIEDWLIREALGSPDMTAMFSGTCERLVAAGIPIARANLAWSTLHPLVNAEAVLWVAGEDALFEQYPHDREDEEDWLQSPIRAMLMAGEDRLRRQLASGNSDPGFPMLRRLRDEGYTDYIILRTPFDLPTTSEVGPTGMMVSWATRAPGGFDTRTIDQIDYLQIRLALAARATIQTRIAHTIAETYLGRHAGRRVLSGSIRHGDGERLDAVIFYSDLRGSTALADSLSEDAYLAHLNAYFDAAAGAVIAAGGDVLDFIGDAILAVFPIDEDGLDAASLRALEAAEHALARLEAARALTPYPLHCGIALTCGEVMFGNIGVADRLTFSVIGRTVNAAARIEAMTKHLATPVLVTSEVAAAAPSAFLPKGSYTLAGFGAEVELFAPRATSQRP
jgi:adenylate cyclase